MVSLSRTTNLTIFAPNTLPDFVSPSEGCELRTAIGGFGEGRSLTTLPPSRQWSFGHFRSVFDLNFAPLKG